MTKREGMTTRGLGSLLVLAAALWITACAGGGHPGFQIPPGTGDALTPARADLASGHVTQAIEKLNNFLRDNPGSALVDEATYLLGRAHLASRDSDSRVLAADFFQRVLRDYPQSRFACDAAYYLAVTYDDLSRPSQLDQDWTLKAIGAYRQFLTSCPGRPDTLKADARIKALTDRLAKKAYDNATLYMRMKLYTAAVIYFQKSLDDYPDSRWACRSALGLGESHLRLRHWSDASTELQRVVDTCRDPGVASRARDLLGKARDGLAQNPPAPRDTSAVRDSISAR